MSIEDTICRPYAKAIFETAIQDNSIEKWKKTLTFINTVASHKKVKRFLSGSLSFKYLLLFFIEISKDIIDEKGKNLIKLLAENQRFKISNNILEHFLKLEASYNKIIIVELTSVFPLEEKQIGKIRKILEDLFLRKIKFIYIIDNRILNGIIIKVNNIVFDLSIRNHIKQLSDALKF